MAGRARGDAGEGGVRARTSSRSRAGSRRLRRVSRRAAEARWLARSGGAENCKSVCAHRDARDRCARVVLPPAASLARPLLPLSAHSRTLREPLTHHQTQHTPCRHPPAPLSSTPRARPLAAPSRGRRPTAAPATTPLPRCAPRRPPLYLELELTLARTQPGAAAAAPNSSHLVSGLLGGGVVLGGL